VAEPIREVFAGTGIGFCQGKVMGIDAPGRRVHVSDGNGKNHTVVYDYAILATGATTNYYDIPGAEANTLPLKDLADAARIRNRIIDSFEESMNCEDPAERERLLTFIVVGGGPTGVETVAEIAEFIQSMIDRYYHGSIIENATIILVHSGDELLSRLASILRRTSYERLVSQGVKVRLKTGVKSVAPRGIILDNGERIDSGTVIWTAGVKAVIPELVGGDLRISSNGRIALDEYFRAIGDDRLFALGDAASYDGEGHGLPMLAQVAVREARVVADNVMSSIRERDLQSFKYQSQGVLISLGNWYAVGEIFSRYLVGWHIWWLWRTVYLFKFASWKKRWRIAGEWFFLLFTKRDITKYDC
jgi:NADH dehydrogenase